MTVLEGLEQCTLKTEVAIQIDSYLMAVQYRYFDKRV